MKCGSKILAKTLIFSVGLVTAIPVVAWAYDLSTESTAVRIDCQQAAAQADILVTPAAYAFAAECLLTEVMLGGARDNKDQSKFARDMAEAALTLTPDHQNARLQYAIADGFITRETGNVSAWMKKLPQKTYAIAQAYRTDFPDDPRGDALLGAWPLAEVRKAGGGDARKWFDARVADGQTLYDTALEKSATDPIVIVNYAFALLALDDADMPTTDVARDWLTRLESLPTETYLENTLKNYGLTALAKINDRDAVRDYCGQFLDGKVPG